MAQLTLTRVEIKSGAYIGTLRLNRRDTSASAQEPGPIQLMFQGRIVSTATLEPLTKEGSGVWRVELPIPLPLISEGVQSFGVTTDDGREILDYFSLIIGDALDQDVRGELASLRAEVEILKRVVRRSLG